jgi:hypothetical protein
MEMKNTGNNLKSGLLKRQEALKKFIATKKTFLLWKLQITSDIEDANTIWINTLKQLPKQNFN